MAVLCMKHIKAPLDWGCPVQGNPVLGCSTLSVLCQDTAKPALSLVYLMWAQRCWSCTPPHSTHQWTQFQHCPFLLALRRDVEDKAQSYSHSVSHLVREKWQEMIHPEWTYCKDSWFSGHPNKSWKICSALEYRILKCWQTLSDFHSGTQVGTMKQCSNSHDREPRVPILWHYYQADTPDCPPVTQLLNTSILVYNIQAFL